MHLSDQKVLDEVAKNRYAIGYCLMRPGEFKPKGLWLIPIIPPGEKVPVKPTRENVLPDKYPLQVTIKFLIRPDASQVARDFIKFACGPEGAQVARKCFLYPEYERQQYLARKRLADMKAGKGEILHGAGPVKGGLALMKEAAVDFVKAKAVVQMAYRGLAESAAVEQFLQGKQQLLLLDEPLSDRTMRAFGAKWKALFAEADEAAAALAAKAATQPAKPTPRVVDTSAGNPAAGRGVAVIVSAKLGLDTLSRRQLGDIFTGKARRWDALSREGLIDPTGHARTERRNRIHICRPRGGSPAVRLFFQGLKIGYLSSVTRYKKDMAEVITAVTMDKNMIGFIDVADVPANSAAVRVLSVSDGAGGGVRPSMAALLDGSYPLSKQLRLYVSPKAGATAKDFARFLLAGGADETFAKHGYVTPGRVRKIAAEKAAKEAAAKAAAKRKGAGGRRR